MGGRRFFARQIIGPSHQRSVDRSIDPTAQFDLISPCVLVIQSTVLDYVDLIVSAAWGTVEAGEAFVSSLGAS